MKSSDTVTRLSYRPCHHGSPPVNKGRQLKVMTKKAFSHLDHPRLDGVIVERLREGDQLLGQELVHEVDSCRDNAQPVGADPVGDVAHLDRVEVLAALRGSWPLYEHLRIPLFSSFVLLFTVFSSFVILCLKTVLLAMSSSRGGVC